MARVSTPNSQRPTPNSQTHAGPSTPNLQLSTPNDQAAQPELPNKECNRTSQSQSQSQLNPQSEITIPIGAEDCGLAPAYAVDSVEWTIQHKPYDLRERLFLFAALIVRVVQFLHTRGPVARELSYQVLKSGTSAGANYEEADDGSSGRDAVAKRRIVLRELKETEFRLRVLRNAGFLTDAHDPVIAETRELVRIMATIVRNQAAKNP